MLSTLSRLAALLAAASAPEPARPPAHLVVPPSLQRERSPKPEKDIVGQLGFAAPEVLAAAGPLDARPGEWVEYGMTVSGKHFARTRLSVLAPPKDAGDDRYWLEVVTAGQIAFPSVIKLLVHGDPLLSRNIERLLVYVAGQAPIELPLEDARDNLSPEKPPSPVKIVRLGASEVTVPAGTFRAEGLRVSARAGRTKIWLAKGKVPLWGLVRSESKDHTIELLHYGEQGAHTVMPPGPGEPDERPDAGAPDQGNGNEYAK